MNPEREKEFNELFKAKEILIQKFIKVKKLKIVFQNMV